MCVCVCACVEWRGDSGATEAHRSTADGRRAHQHFAHWSYSETGDAQLSAQQRN